MSEGPKPDENQRPINPALLGIGIALLASSPMLGRWYFALIFPGIVLLAAAGVFGSRKQHDHT